MTVVVTLAAVVAYLLIGYAWSMLYIHKITDGYWDEGYRKVPMGIGTALSFTLLWPAAILATVIILVGLFVVEFSSNSLWKKIYRLD